MPQFSDDLRLGAVNIGAPEVAGSANPAPMSMGVGPLGRLFVWDFVPLAQQTNGIALSQTPGAAGDLVLTAGSNATTVTRADGAVVVQLDVPRSVTIAAAGANAATFTVYGYDVYGQPMSQLLAAPSTSTVSTLKSFKQVSRIAISGAAGSAITAGFGNKFGIPFRVPSIEYISSVKWNSGLPQDAGTFVVADTTAPATASTGDVRGTYNPANAADGAKRLVMVIALTALACGPQATRVGALGVDQV